MEAVGVHLEIRPGEPEDLPELLGHRAAVPEQRTGAKGHCPERRLDAANPELVPGPRHVAGAFREARGPLGDLPEFEVESLRRDLHEHEVQKERVALVESEGEPHVPAGEFVGRPWNGIRRRRRRRVARRPAQEHGRNQRQATGAGGGTADSGSVCGAIPGCIRKGLRERRRTRAATPRNGNGISPRKCRPPFDGRRTGAYLPELARSTHEGDTDDPEGNPIRPVRDPRRRARRARLWSARDRGPDGLHHRGARRPGRRRHRDRPGPVADPRRTRADLPAHR